jgi:endoglucanase
LFAVPLVLVLLLVDGFAAPVPSHPAGRAVVTGQPGQPPLALRVSGNHLVDASGATVRLLGVDRSGGEYACVQGWGMMDGPSDGASIAAIAAWHANAVRLPLNEDCWLGINGVAAAYSGANYQAFVEGFVQRLHAAGIYVILDLHWNAPGAYLATDQQAMADADHSITFWSQVASVFGSDPATVFDLYNEPFVGLGGSKPSTDAWICWRDGCSVGLLKQAGRQSAVTWQTAGMQQLVDAVRSTGARNVLILGGLAWANDASGWLSHLPADALGQVALSAHVYGFNACADVTCWDATFGAIAAGHPVVTGEFGERDCQTTFQASYWTWADAHGISYLDWTWDAWGANCNSSAFFLISNYDGTPIPYGQAFHDHLLAMP